jgi:hypothetical protein
MSLSCPAESLHDVTKKLRFASRVPDMFMLLAGPASAPPQRVIVLPSLDSSQVRSLRSPLPADVRGVDVILTVVDPNGNFQNIGTTTSDASGTFSYQWTPEIAGKHTLIATFAGSESYWTSYSQTAIGVHEAPQPTNTEQPISTPTSFELYFIASTAAIIIAIAIVGLMIIRKRP